MKKSNRKIVGMTIVAILIASIFVAFASTGGTQSANVDNKECYGCSCLDVQQIFGSDILELKGKAEHEAVAKALDNEDVKILHETLVEKGYTPQMSYSKAVKMGFKNESKTMEVTAVVIPYKGDSNSAQIIFVTDGKRAEAGAGIINAEEESKRVVIEVFELKESVLTTHIIENNDGVITMDGRVIPTVSTKGASSCEICMSVCTFIIAAGCSVSGYFVCVAACIPFSGPVCPVLRYAGTVKAIADSSAKTTVEHHISSSICCNIFFIYYWAKCTHRVGAPEGAPSDSEGVWPYFLFVREGRDKNV